MNASLGEFCRNALQIGVGLWLQSGLLLALGMIAGWLLRRRGPELRAFVYQVTLAGVALGALLSVSLVGHVQPVWSVRLGSPPALGTPATQETPPARRGSPPPPAGEDTEIAGQMTLPSEYGHPPRNGEVASLSEPEGSLSLLWLTVTGLLLLWLVLCQSHLTRLRRAARPITAGRAAKTLARLTASSTVRPPDLLQSPQVRSPFLAGILRPAIFLPSSWDADFDDTALHVVLAHELAHLKRRDCAWTLLLRLTTALLWPQPLLWLLARQLDQATEEACDLLALTPGCPPRRYADCLLRLADRTLPGPAARTLGTSVVPVRSSLGRRIQTLLDRKNLSRQPLSVRSHQMIAVGVGLLALGVGVALVPRLTVPDFSWAKAQGWDVQPVRVVRLEPKILRAFEPLPPSLSYQDATIAYLCWYKHYPPSADNTDAQRQFFEETAARYPLSFYPKHCLAIWYEGQHQLAQYRYWEQQALRQAPQILAGRITYPDGKPVANATYRIELFAYEPKNFESRRSISYDWETVTDQEGCYYLPVYRGLYTIPYSPGFFGPAVVDAKGGALNAFFEGGKTSDSLATVPSEPITLAKQTMGMTATSHVGILPAIIARSPIQVTTPLERASTDEKHPTLLSGSILHFAWKPTAGAQRYTIQVDMVGTDGKGGRTVIPAFPGPNVTTNEADWNLPVNGPDLFSSRVPVLCRYKVYRLRILAHNSRDTQRFDDVINSSDECDFVPTDAPPIPLTRASFLRALGPGGSISTFITQGNETTISGSAPVGTVNYNTLAVRFEPLFGQEDDDGYNNNVPLGMTDAQGRQTFDMTITRDVPDTLSRTLHKP